MRRLAEGALACVVAAAVPFAALAAAHAPAWPGAPTGALALGLALALLAACCFAQGERRVRGLHGWRRPTGFGWLGALPFALVGALAGGVWVPAAEADASLFHVALASLLCAGGAELLFRGFLHGRLHACAAPRAPGSGMLAPPVLLSGLLYAAVGGALAALGAFAPSPLAATGPALAAGGALLFGLAAGAARESSGSVAAPFALHVLGAAALLAATTLGIVR